MYSFFFYEITICSKRAFLSLENCYCRSPVSLLLNSVSKILMIKIFLLMYSSSEADVHVTDTQHSQLFSFSRKFLLLSSRRFWSRHLLIISIRIPILRTFFFACLRKTKTMLKYKSFYSKEIYKFSCIHFLIRSFFVLFDLK